MNDNTSILPQKLNQYSNLNTSGSSIFLPDRGNEEEVSFPLLDYEECFVAYLDILGFKELVDKQEKSRIAEYFYLIKKILAEIEILESKEAIQYIVISDSIILSLKTGGLNNKITNFRQLCVAVRNIQLNLARHNLFLRGGISYGEAYTEDNNIVGKAYQNAYLLGEEQAVFPRVIIDPGLISYLNFSTRKEFVRTVNSASSKTPVLFDMDSFGTRKLLKTDDVLFIDYLSSCVKRPVQLRDIVESIKKNIYLNQKIYGKYRWVVDYLNACCAKQEGGEVLVELDDLYHEIDRL